MEEDKVILVYPGFWTGPVFKNGEEALVFVSLRTTPYKEFLDEVHKLVQADQRVCEYVLHCFIHVEDGLKKSFLMSDRDLQRVAKIFGTPKIYVSFKPKHLGMNAPNHGNGMFDKVEGNFASQGTNANPYPYPYPYWSAPYFHGAGPSSGPWAWPGLSNQPNPNGAPIVNKPKPSSKPAVNDPKPNSALVVNQPKSGPMSLANQTRLLKRTDYRNNEAYKRRRLGFKGDGCSPVEEEFYSDDDSSC